MKRFFPNFGARQKREIGIIQILLSGICFGTLGIFGKWAYEKGLTPGEFLSMRFLIGAALLASWLAITDRRSLRLPLKALLHCFLLGALGYAVFSSFFFEALKGLSASLTYLLLYTYPVMVSLGAWIFMGERLHRAQKIALPVVVSGLLLLVWGDFQVYAKSSLLFGFLAAVFYSIYILTSSRVLKNIPAQSSTLYIMLSAGVLLSIFHVRAHTFEILPSAWLVAAGTGLIGSLLAMSLFLAGLQKLTNAEASILSTSEPVTGVIFAAIFLGERMRAEQFLGAALILGAMILIHSSVRPQAAP